MRITDLERKLLSTISKFSSVKAAAHELKIRPRYAYVVLSRLRTKYKTCRSVVNTIDRYKGMNPTLGKLLRDFQSLEDEYDEI